MNAVATARIGARISPELHQMFKRAADIQGRTLTDFLITAAREAALRVIKDNDIISLSLKDQRRIADALLAPQESHLPLQKAIKAHDDLIRVE